MRSLLRRGGGHGPLNSAAARRLRVSVDPSGNGIGCRDIPALPGPCSHHGCTGRGACLPSGGCLAVPLKRRFCVRHLCLRLFALPQSRLTASSNMRRLCAIGSVFSFLLCRVMASPGDSVHALQQKRTGRRQILSSPVGDLISWSYLRPVLTQDIFTFSLPLPLVQPCSRHQDSQ